MIPSLLVNEMAPRGKQLSAHEKGKIEALQACGKSIRAISRECKRSECVIRNFLSNPAAYGTAKHPGRPKTLSSRNARQVVRKASNSMKSCETIRRELSLEVSRTTIWRTIKADGNIVRSQKANAPRLEERHKVARMNFARTNMTRSWIEVSGAQSGDWQEIHMIRSLQFLLSWNFCLYKASLPYR